MIDTENAVTAAGAQLALPVDGGTLFPTLMREEHEYP